jgi:hypothetical protein
VWVSPADAVWTAGPQTISVSSTNAKQINYTYTKTEDGSEPAVPADPSISNVFLGQIAESITGASGTFTVPSSANKNTRIKIRFCGKNDTGYGAVTSAYSYAINLLKTYQFGDTLSPSDAKAVPGLNITAIITTTVNGASILDPTAKFLKVDATHSYSVADLVVDYLKTLLKDSSVHADTSSDGVMTIGSPNFGGIVFTLITGSLATTAESDSFSATALGNIQICTKNIKIILYPAGADQALFKQTIESYGWTVSYGADHTLLVSTPDYLMSFRFQLFADKSRPLATGASQCLFSAGTNGYGIGVTYPDGTIQNIVPYVHDPDAFAAYLMTSYSLTCGIDSYTGMIYINNDQGGILWKGVPDFMLSAPGQDVMNSEIQPNVQNQSLNLLFLTTTGSQVIFEKK